MMEKEMGINQIILVTDGQSNTGGSPISAAKEAYNKNIIVNTIGLIGKNKEEEKPLAEIIDIAEAGGGIYEYTYIEELYQTMQSITYRTVNKTIQEAVNKQLGEMMGQGLDDIPPASRSKLLRYIDSFSDRIGLYCVIVLDTSASMGKKIPAARNSILDLLDSLKSRKGKVELGVVSYPGKKEDSELIFNLGEKLDQLEERLYKIETRGVTPTAPAIYRATDLLLERLGQGQMELEKVRG